MSEIELKACPFCGGEAGIRKWQDEELWSHAIVEWQKAHCTKCECEGISSCPGYDPDTVEAWNTRAPEWHPIETAPKTTRSILVWCPERQNQYMVSWDERYEGEWRTVGGWTALTEAPTHWQPLPAPPEVVG